MPGENITAPTPEAAPAAPSVAAASAPVIEAPVAASAPVVTPEVVPVVAETPKAVETLLGAEPPKPAEVKTEEVAKPIAEGEKPVEEKKAESDQSDKPASLPTYEKFTVPEGITLKDENLGEFTKLLGEYELESKADHAVTQKLGQELMNRHIAEVQRTIKQIGEYNQKTWDDQKIAWKDQFLLDPVLGGANQDSTLSAAREFIITHGGSSEQQTEFRNLMETTGIGNHPAMIRMLANAMKAKAEGKPLPANTPVPKVQSKIQRRYGGNKNN